MSAVSRAVIDRLLYRESVATVAFAAKLTTKHKRKIFAAIRKLSTTHDNFIFVNYMAITLGEFCLTQVLLTDNTRKFKEHVANQLLEKY